MSSITVIQNYLSLSGRDILFGEAMIKLSDAQIEDVYQATLLMTEQNAPEYEVRHMAIRMIDELLHPTLPAPNFTATIG